MSHKRMRRKLAIRLAGAALTLCATPAVAQDAAHDIDMLIDATASPAGTLKLARSQAEQGDLTGAAATLERALLDQPTMRDASVRLYYITILCRLDDHERARLEMARIDPRAVGMPAADEARAACGTLQLPTAAAGDPNSGLTGNIALGMAYDTDASAALIPAFVIPGVTPPSADGLAIVGSARIDGRTPLGGGYVYGGLSGVTKNSISGPRLDYQLGTLRTGFGMQGNGVGFELGGLLRHGRLYGHPFYSEYGGQAEISTATGAETRIALRGELVHQDYMNSFAFADRDGTRYDLALELRGQDGPDKSYVVGAAYEASSARTRNLGYSGWRLYAAARLPLNHAGTYTALSATVRHVDYRDVALVTDRVETRWFGRAAIGKPLGSSPVDIEGAVSYTRRDYNAASFLHDYDSVGVELRLVLNFGR